LAKGLSKRELLVFARAGAQARMDALREELAALQAAFGRARRAGSSGRSTRPAPMPRHRRKMSAAARKRISEIQKKRWAKWRKEKAVKKK